MYALLSAGLVAPAMGEAPVAQAPAVDLMKMNRDARCKQVLVTCLINGTPMRMMLDTGATHTVLHTESAARVPNAQWIDTSHIQFKGNPAYRPGGIPRPPGDGDESGSRAQHDGRTG